MEKRAKKAGRLLASIIIPTLNEGKRLRPCLASMADQSVPRKAYEIIVADGHSTDETIPIARKMADKVVLERKRTIAAGRQKGAKAAEGKILVFSDGDSIADRDWLEPLLAAFKDPEVVSAHGALKPIEMTFARHLLFGHLLSPYFAITAALGLPSGAGSSLAVRADAFGKAGGFDTDLVTGEDVELQKRLKKMGKCVFVPSSVMAVSFRRVERWGYLRFILFHSANFFRTHFLGSPAREYEHVR